VKKSEGKDDKKNNPRRSFLTILWIGLGIIALGEALVLVIAFLKSRKPQAMRGDARTRIMTAGRVDDFEPNSVTAFQKGRFYLSRLKDGGFLALSRQCTHLGCTVPWVEEEGTFICPCHASKFDRAGNALSSPAPRALDLFPVVIENNMVTVDTGRRLRRSEFRAEQVTYPS